MRAPKAEMLTTFDAAVRELEPALQTMKVEAIAIRGQPVFKNSEVREGNDERAEVHEAASALLAALDAEKDLLLIGIGTFADLAAIDDSKPPPFIENLAKSLVVAAAGHLIGEAMGASLQHSTKAPQSPPLA